MSNTVKLFESFQQNLTEIESTDFFKTEGLEIARDICKDNNQHCEEVATTVVDAALNKDIDCKVVKPLVINGEDINNNHYAIQYNNKIIDYCAAQFLGDNTKVDCFELLDNGNNRYVLNKDTLVGASVRDITDAKTYRDIINNTELTSLYLIEIV